MYEARYGLRLPLELFHEIGIVAKFLEHDLHGDGAVEHLVAPHVDASHATGAKLTLKKEIPVFAERPRRLDQLFAHLIILHPLNGQKTTDAEPRRFSRGTGPQ